MYETETMKSRHRGVVKSALPTSSQVVNDIEKYWYSALALELVRVQDSFSIILNCKKDGYQYCCRQ
jgi:hypothetical protein